MTGRIEEIYGELLKSNAEFALVERRCRELQDMIDPVISRHRDIEISGEEYASIEELQEQWLILDGINQQEP